MEVRDYKISDEMVSAWTNFMKSSEPGKGWKPYTEENSFYSYVSIKKNTGRVLFLLALFTFRFRLDRIVMRYDRNQIRYCIVDNGMY